MLMTPRGRAVWEPEQHKVFVDLCVEQRMLGNRPGLHHMWETFQQRTGGVFTQIQLRNHWDTMLRQWKIWCRLVQCSDLKWDPKTKTFGASDQDWANYFVVHPEADQYRFRLTPPSWFKDLKIIFEGTNFDDEGTSCGKRKRIPDEATDTGDEDITIPRLKAFKAYWSSSSHELFLDLLVKESLRGNTTRRNSYYPKETWNMMVESFNQKTGLCYTREQLKNRWNVTRDAWKLWCQAIGSPLLKWDANTNTFGATSEDWENYSKENKKAEVFRLKHIPHADKLAIIFKGHIEPGKVATRPYRKRVINHHSQAPQDPAPSSALNINEPVVTGSEGGADDFDTVIDESPHDPAPLSTLYTNELVTGNEGGADDGDNDGDDEPTPHYGIFNGVGVAESQDVVTAVTQAPCHRFNIELVEKIPATASVKEYEFTIGECMKCLDAMEEVEKGSDLYMFALDLFVKKEYREIFLLLKTSSLRMSWLVRRHSGGSTIAA